METIKNKEFSAVWSKEVHEDLTELKGYSNIDAEKELTRILEEELRSELATNLRTFR